MKPLTSFFAALFLSLACVFVMSCIDHKNKETDAFTRMQTLFDDSAAFARVELDGQPVFLVSTETYQNEDAVGRSVLTAIAAQIYVEVEPGQVVCLGEIRSQGTAYPLSTDGKMLFTAGHRFVHCYSVDSEPRELRLDECVDGEVVAPDSVVYSYENRIEQVYENNKNEAFFNQQMHRFSKANPVTFERLPKRPMKHAMHRLCGSHRMI